MNRDPVFFGLLHRRTCIVPTTRVLLIFCGALIVLAIFVCRSIYPFLALNDPKSGGLLVVGGWENERTLALTIREIEQRQYSHVLVLGGRFTRGAPLSAFASEAEFGTATLTRLSGGKVKALPILTPVSSQDNAASAISVREWMKAHASLDDNLTVLCGPDSRRVRLIYSRIFPDGKQVGIIAAPALGYDSNHWWTSSEGVRTVTDQALAYVYERLFRRAAE